MHTPEQVAAQLSADIVAGAAAVSRLQKRVTMLRCAQSHLRGIPASQNLSRIAAAEDELSTQTFLLELNQREGTLEAEIAACTC